MRDLVASIIINNHNYGRFLGDAIDSALAQTYPHTEVIVVDDGSTDASREVIERYGKQIRSVFKANGGQGSAFNAGFPHSSGDVICFLDSDDILYPSAMQNAAAMMTAPEVMKVEWVLRIIDENAQSLGQIVPERFAPQDELRERTIRDGPFYDWLITPPSSGNAFARSMLNAVLPVPECDYRNGADVYLTVLAPLYGNIRRISEPQGCYRIHGSNNYFGRRLDDARLMNYLRRFDAACRAVQTHLERQGIAADPDGWRERNFNYLWPSRLLGAKQDLARTIPAGSRYVLVDDGELIGQQVLSSCEVLPFIERNGDYYGPPSTDSEAISELERLRDNGAQFLVFWWTSFWWLAHYVTFTHYLKSTYRQVVASDRLVVFDLGQSA